MEKQEAIAIVEQSDSKTFLVDGERKRMFISTKGDLCTFMHKSRKKGYVIPDSQIAQWKEIKDVGLTRFQKDVNALIFLFLNPPSCSSRVLDKYLEEGEYTDKLCEAVLARARKNKTGKLYRTLVCGWPWFSERLLASE